MDGKEEDVVKDEQPLLPADPFDDEDCEACAI